MTDQILAQPSPMELAFSVESQLEIGGSYFLEGYPEGWSVSELIIPANVIAGTNALQKNNTDGNGIVLGTRQIPAVQPFSTEWSFTDDSVNPANPFTVQVGVVDDIGHITLIENYRFPPEEEERFQVYADGAHVNNGNYYPGVHSDRFQIVSNGQVIRFLRFVSGRWIEVYGFPIPAHVNYYKWRYNLVYHGNYIYTLRLRIEDKIIPVTTYNTDFFSDRLEQRIIDSTHYGLTGFHSGDFNMVLSNPHVAQNLGVRARVRPLYIKPKFQSCGTYVIYGETIQFITNGTGGVFEADGGTIFSSLKWQAPYQTGVVNFTYRIGDYVANCQLNVVPQLSVDGVNEDGFYPDLAQGEMTDLIANCPQATFRCVNFPQVVTSTGHFVAPTDAQNPVFGEKICDIEVTGCGQIYHFKLRIQPMFPTPKFCGPAPQNWQSPLMPDYLPTKVEMTGGTTQVKNRNRLGIKNWEIAYQNLRNTAPEGCSCDDPLVHRENCSLSLETSSRLDAFYNQVKYTNYFTVLDYHTEIMYKYVRLTKYDGNHNLFETEQTRNVTMRQEGDVLF